MQRHPQRAVGGGVQNLARRQLRTGGSQSGTAGPDDELSDTMGGIRNTRCVQGLESFVPVVVAVEHDVRAACVEVLPDLLVRRMPARAGCCRGEAWVLRVRQVSLLDGDVIRRHLSGELGYLRWDRDQNVHRIGYVASEITKHGGVAICAVVARTTVPARRCARWWSPECAPSRACRHLGGDVRVARHQGPLRARGAGELTGLTGVSDPYEEPVDADPVLDTQEVGAEECADRILMGADGTGLPRTSPTDALCLKGAMRSPRRRLTRRCAPSR